MKLLLTCPILNNASVTRSFLDSIVNQRQEIVLLVNGDSDPEIAPLIREYQSNYPSIKEVIWEPENTFVTKPWNKFLKYFLDHEEYTHILLLNSDLIIQHDFFKNLAFVFSHPNGSNFVPIPVTVNKVQVFNFVDWRFPRLDKVESGTAGICIILHREAAKICYPIDERIKIWFNDNWCYELCRAAGYTTYVVDNLQVFHEGSQTVKSVDGIMEVIEEDKIAWREKVLPELEEKIKKLKETNGTN